MADKILDVRHVMDEMVSPEGLQAGGGQGGDIFEEGYGIKIEEGFEPGTKMISVDPAIVQTGEVIYADIELFGGTPHETSQLKLTTSNPSTILQNTISYDEDVFRNDNGDTFTPKELHNYLLTHNVKMIQITFKEFLSGGGANRLTLNLYYNTSSSRLISGMGIPLGNSELIDYASQMVMGTTALPLYMVSLEYHDDLSDPTNVFISWNIQGQLEVSDGAVAEVIDSVNENVIPVPTYASRTLVYSRIAQAADNLPFTLDSDGWYVFELLAAVNDITSLRCANNNTLCTASGTMNSISLPIKAGTQLKINMYGNAGDGLYVYKIN